MLADVFYQSIGKGGIMSFSFSPVFAVLATASTIPAVESTFQLLYCLTVLTLSLYVCFGVADWKDYITPEKSGILFLTLAVSYFLISTYLIVSMTKATHG